MNKHFVVNAMDSSNCCAIGWTIYERMNKLLPAYSAEIEEQFLWVEEVVSEAQKTMTRAEILLLPKTPTEKQKRLMRRHITLESSPSERRMIDVKSPRTHCYSDSQLFKMNRFSVGDRVTLHQSPHLNKSNHDGHRYRGAGNCRRHLQLSIDGKLNSHSTDVNVAHTEPRNDHERMTYDLDNSLNTSKKMNAAEHMHRSQFPSTTCRSSLSSNFLEPFPQNWCDISIEDEEKSAIAIDAQKRDNLVTHPILAKCLSPVETSPVKSFGRNLVSTGVQTEFSPYEKNSCTCQSKVMVNQDIQTEDAFVIEVSCSAQGHRADLSTSLHEQQGSPAVAEVQRLSRYFPNIADGLALKAEGNAEEEFFTLPESQCLEGGCGEDVAIASEQSDISSLASLEEAKPISKWETSVNLNNVSDCNFGAVAYDSHSLYDGTSSAKCMVDEERESCSFRNSSDQSGMSLAIEMSKAKRVTGLQITGHSQLSGKTIIREDSSESLPSTALDLESKMKVSLQDDYVELLKLLAADVPLLSKHVDGCVKLAEKSNPAPAFEKQSQLLPAASPSIAGVVRDLSKPKANSVVIPKVSRAPPPPPRRPPVGNVTAILLNNKSCNPDKSTRLQNSLALKKSSSNFIKEDCSSVHCSVLASNVNSSPVLLNDCSRSPVGIPISCDALTLTCSGQKTIVGTPLQAASNNVCSVSTHISAGLQNHNKCAGSIGTAGRASCTTSGARISGTRRQSRSTEQRCRPSGTPRSSKVKGGPRLSVGRKSLSKRRSVGVQEKYHSSKLTRPVAWLLNATKSTKRKTKGGELSGKITAESTDMNSSSSATRVQQTAAIITPAKIVSTGSFRSKIQKLQNVFSPKPGETQVIRCEMLPPSTPVVPRTNIKERILVKVPASPALAGTRQGLHGLTTPSKSQLSSTSLKSCFSPGRESSLEQVPAQTSVQVVAEEASSITRTTSGKCTKNKLQSSREKQTPKRGLFHRIQDRMKAKQEAADAKSSANKHSASELTRTLHSQHQKTIPATLQDKCSRPEDHVQDSPFKKNHLRSISKVSNLSGTSLQSASSGSTKSGLNRTFLSRVESQTISNYLPAVGIQLHTSVGIEKHVPQSTGTTTVEVHCSKNETYDVEEDDDEYNNYDITEICSDDSTDDETNPKMPPPSWAEENRIS